MVVSCCFVFSSHADGKGKVGYGMDLANMVVRFLVAKVRFLHDKKEYIFPKSPFCAYFL